MDIEEEGLILIEEIKSEKIEEIAKSKENDINKILDEYDKYKKKFYDCVESTTVTGLDPVFKKSSQEFWNFKVMLEDEELIYYKNSNGDIILRNKLLETVIVLHLNRNYQVIACFEEGEDKIIILENGALINLSTNELVKYDRKMLHYIRSISRKTKYKDMETIYTRPLHFAREDSPLKKVEHLTYNHILERVESYNIEILSHNSRCIIYKET